VAIADCAFGTLAGSCLLALAPSLRRRVRLRGTLFFGYYLAASLAFLTSSSSTFLVSRASSPFARALGSRTTRFSDAR